MIAWLRIFVQNIVVIIVLSTLLQVILPSGSMQRYAQLAMGLVLVLALLTPLVNLLRMPFSIADMLGQAQVETAWANLQADNRLQQESDRQVLIVYEAAIAEQVVRVVEGLGKLQVVSVRASLNEDRSSPDFGRITGLVVQARERKQGVQPIAPVQPVTIGEQASQPTVPVQAEIQAAAAEAERELARYFSLTVNQVQVTFR